MACLWQIYYICHSLSQMLSKYDLISVDRC